MDVYWIVAWGIFSSDTDLLCKFFESIVLILEEVWDEEAG